MTFIPDGESVCVPLISSVRHMRALQPGDVALVQSDRSGMAASGHIELTGIHKHAHTRLVQV